MENKTFTSAQSLGRYAAMGQSNSRSSDAKKPKFTLFPKLPVELRIKIWKESYEPRIIELRTTENWRSTRYDFVIPKFPAALHVNKEARLEALKDYKMSFKHRQCRRSILFNFSLDTLHIRDCSLSHYSSWRVSNTIQTLPDKEKVQKLSVTFGAFVPRYSEPPAILLFPALEEVTVCSLITPGSAYIVHGQSSGYYLKSHLGKCIKGSDASSCFPKNSKLRLDPQLGSQPISNIKQAFFRDSKIVVKKFLKGQRSGEWGGAKWQEPCFSFRGLCIKSFESSEETFYCPPRPTPPKKLSKAASKRVSEKICGVSNAISE
jgi:hypothetical protein